jgi:hypothetical protein
MLQDIWKVKTNAWRGQYTSAGSRFDFPADDQRHPHETDATAERELARVP